MPKMDEDGLLWCDGRLCYAEFLPYEVRFPLILPRGTWVTKLIVKHYHEIGQAHHKRKYEHGRKSAMNVREDEPSL